MEDRHFINLHSTLTELTIVSRPAGRRIATAERAVGAYARFGRLAQGTQTVIYKSISLDLIASF